MSNDSEYPRYGRLYAVHKPAKMTFPWMRNERGIPWSYATARDGRTVTVHILRIGHYYYAQSGRHRWPHHFFSEKAAMNYIDQKQDRLRAELKKQRVERT